MTRFCTALVLVAAVGGCTAPELITYDQEGRPLRDTLVVLAPLCLAFCNTSINTSGSNVSALNSEGLTTSNANTQSTTQQGGSSGQ